MTWWERHAGRPFDPALLLHTDVRDWRQARQQGDGAAPATINRALSMPLPERREIQGNACHCERPERTPETRHAIHSAPIDGTSQNALPSQSYQSGTLAGYPSRER